MMRTLRPWKYNSIWCQCSLYTEHVLKLIACETDWSVLNTTSLCIHPILQQITNNPCVNTQFRSSVHIFINCWCYMSPPQRPIGNTNFQKQTPNKTLHIYHTYSCDSNLTTDFTVPFIMTAISRLRSLINRTLKFSYIMRPFLARVSLRYIFVV